MQINGSLLSTVFIASAQDARDPIRPPIIIDATPSKRAPRPLLPATTEASPFQTVLSSTEDVQQQRFVRLFAQTTEHERVEFKTETALPRGVQQYVQIAQLDIEPQQRLFDESV
jgi:hypothetical protein